MHVAANSPPRNEPAPGNATPAELTRDFERIYESHVQFIWRAVRGLGVPERNVDDAVQDVFIVVHRHLAEFEGRSSIRSWLFGIARRVAADHRRWAQRKDRGEQLRDAHASGPPQLEAVASAEAFRTLQRILDGFDRDKREAFILIEIVSSRDPHVSRRQLMVFPRDGLQIRLTNVQVKYKIMMVATVATVNRGKLVELRGAGQMRKFSTLIVARDDDTPFLVRDLEQIASGQPALGRDTPLVPHMPRTEYDDRLDRELSELD